MYSKQNLSNCVIRQRLLGGAGTVTGASKNLHTKYNKAFKGIKRVDRPDYLDWKKEFLKPKEKVIKMKVVKKKKVKKKKRRKCIIADNVKIFSKNLSFNEPAPMKQPSIPTPPPLLPRVKPTLFNIEKNVDNMSIDEVIKMNDFLKEDAREKENLESGKLTRKNMLSELGSVKLKKAPKRPKRPKKEHIDFLMDAIKNPKLKDSKKRKLAPPIPKRPSVSEQIHEELLKKTEKRQSIDELMRRTDEKQKNIDKIIQEMKSDLKMEGSGYYPSQYYDDNVLDSKRNLSNRHLMLLNRRGAYAY